MPTAAAVLASQRRTRTPETGQQSRRLR